MDSPLFSEFGKERSYLQDKGPLSNAYPPEEGLGRPERRRRGVTCARGLGGVEIPVKKQTGQPYYYTHSGLVARVGSHLLGGTYPVQTILAEFNLVANGQVSSVERSLATVYFPLSGDLVAPCYHSIASEAMTEIIRTHKKGSALAAFDHLEPEIA